MGRAPWWLSACITAMGRGQGHPRGGGTAIGFKADPTLCCSALRSGLSQKPAHGRQHPIESLPEPCQEGLAERLPKLCLGDWHGTQLLQVAVVDTTVLLAHV